jgi:hypothetical protein
MRIAGKTTAKLEQLRLQVTEWKTPPKDRIARARQLRWIRISARAKALQEEFRDLRSQLVAILSALSALVDSFTLQRASQEYVPSLES